MKELDRVMGGENWDHLLWIKVAGLDEGDRRRICHGECGHGGGGGLWLRLCERGRDAGTKNL